MRSSVHAAIAAIVALALAPPALAAAHPPTLARERYDWRNVQIGGGGYVTGIVVHPTAPGVAFARTDVGGAYRWDEGSGSWVPLMEGARYPDNEWQFGIESIAVSPNDPKVVYVAAGKYLGDGTGAVLKSTDSGTTWAVTGLRVPMGANEDLRWAGERLAVDANDPRVVYFGSRTAGLWRSRDAAVTWERVAGVPAGTVGTGVTFVSIDAASSRPGSASPLVYAGVAGKGVYRRGADDKWALLAGGAPVDQLPVRGVVGKDGVLFVTHARANKAGGVWRYDGAWRRVTPPTAAGKPFAALASSAGTTMVATRTEVFGETIFRSTDNGATWSRVRDGHLSQSPWWPTEFFSAATAALAIDPRDTRRAWATDWFGAWRSADVTSKDWVGLTNGMEETVVLSATTPSRGAPVLTGMADVDGFRHAALGSRPSRRLGGPALQSTTSIDFEEADPDFLARVGTPEDGCCSYGGVSRDNGATWTPFPGRPAGAENGTLAVSATSERIVWSPQTGGTYVSTDAGRSWAASRGALGQLDNTLFSFNLPLAADRVDGSRFFQYSGRTGTLARSTDGGASFSVATTGLPRTEWPGEAYWVKAVPGRIGEVLVSVAGEKLYRWRDSTKSLSAVSGVEKTLLFGFGKAASPTSQPALYVYGRVTGTDGIFRSDDLGATWARIDSDATRIGDRPTVLEGDRQVWGRLYIGTAGRGLYVGSRA